MKKNIPSYYSIIPARVRYDFKRLSWFEIVLFGELTALSTVHGYAFPSNQYLADLYGVSLRTISSSLAHLSDAGHILIEIDKEKGNERRIYITTLPIEKKFYTPIEKNDYTPKDYFNKERFIKKDYLKNINPALDLFFQKYLNKKTDETDKP